LNDVEALEQQERENQGGGEEGGRQAERGRQADPKERRESWREDERRSLAGTEHESVGSSGHASRCSA